MASPAEISVSVSGLAKAYSLARNLPRHTTLAEAVMHSLRRPLRRARTEQFWALRDVSFDVREGEALGIIGRNGAGKSTLLKLLSRITSPTHGQITLYGPVGSLLEVGTGFHPELTGRENIFLNGSILGMRRKEIARRFDEIVAFAEVDRFIDTPVKRYSSGMYVRLAFAVAAHLNPQILVVDEVLAVGDASFQKKCLGKMGEVTSQEGRTVLFVSHNMTAVQSLCGRALWMDGGTLREEGRPNEIVPRYLRTAFSPRRSQTWDNPKAAPGNNKVRLRRVCIQPQTGPADALIDTHMPLLVEFEYWNLVAGTAINLSASVLNEEGAPIFNTVPLDEPVWHGRPFPMGLFRSSFRIPADLLNDGSHRVLLYIVEDQSIVLSRHEDVLVFDVVEAPGERQGWFGKWEGAVRPKLQWTTELIEQGAPADSALITMQKEFIAADQYR
jgi:lipopolysaccharide transport system ATP-binding protein